MRCSWFVKLGCKSINFIILTNMPTKRRRTTNGSTRRRTRRRLTPLSARGGVPKSRAPLVPVGFRSFTQRAMNLEKNNFKVLLT